MNQMREFRRQLRASLGKVLAYQIADGYGAAASAVFERVIRGERVPDAELSEVAAFGEDRERGPQHVAMAAGPTIIPGAGQGKSVALVTARGVAMYDLEYQPYCFSTLLLAQVINGLANDPEVGTIVIDINSPGGQVTGTPEAGDAIYAARQKKRVVALVNPLCASAAYWLAAQATQIVAIPSADIGSIGVFMLHAECSGLMEQSGIKPTFIFAGEHKVEGNPYEPLADSAREHWQGEVDEIYADFLKAVARGRGRTVAEVRELFGKGRTMGAPAAKKVGMIDLVASIDVAYARAGVPASALNGRRRMEETAPVGPSAETPDDPPVALVDDADTDPTDGQDLAADEGTAAAAPNRARHRRLALLRA